MTWVINIRDFKSIADECMKDIKVSEELKDKTLMCCQKKRNINLNIRVNRLLVPAASFVLILATVGVLNLLPPKTGTGEDNAAQPNIMAATDNAMEVAPGQTTVDILSGSDSEAIESWSVTNPDEARKIFGDAFIMPGYIPEGFKLEEILASGYKGEMADKIILNYVKEELSFSITEETKALEDEFSGYKKIDINGVSGYLKEDGTEVHWFLDGVHYSVAGHISSDEALRVAASMKR